MKEKSTPQKKRAASKGSDELAANYDFDYAKAKPNRFAGQPQKQVVVLLDKELSQVFRTEEEVTNALRSLIHAMPAKLRARRKAA